MREMERKPEKKTNWIAYIIFLVVWFIGWEIAVNHFQYTFSQVISIVYAGLTLLASFGVHNKKLNIAERLKRWGRGAKRTLEIRKVTLAEHITYALIEVGSRILYPIFRRGVAGKVFLILFLLAPLLVTAHPAAVTINTVKKGVEAVGEGLRLSEFSKDEEEAFQDTAPEEKVSNFDGETEEEKEGNSNQVLDEYLDGDMTEPDQGENEAEDVNGDSFFGNFVLKSAPSKEEVDKVYRMILYYAGTYPIQGDTSVGEMEDIIAKRLEDTASMELLYMSEFFKVSDKKITVSELNDMEYKFLNAISEGVKYESMSAPDSSILDEVIRGRSGLVCKKKDYHLASQLANDYLRYTLEYYNQGKTDENTIYYSGMAILAGELQLCYAESEDERERALEWIVKRYQEINDLGLLEKYCEELDIPEDDRLERIQTDKERLNDILTCLDKIKKEGDGSTDK